jgi:hypothetical protein
MSILNALNNESIIINKIIDNMVSKVHFTAYDITKFLRSNNINISNNKVKAVIQSMHDKMPEYTKTMVQFPTGNLFVYHPINEKPKHKDMVDFEVSEPVCSVSITLKPISNQF